MSHDLAMALIISLMGVIVGILYMVGVLIHDHKPNHNPKIDKGADWETWKSVMNNFDQEEE